MRSVVILALLVLPGCASAPGSAITDRDATVRVSDGSSIMRVQPTGGMASAPLAYSADAVFAVLPAVLDSLGISVGTLDSDQRVIGNTGLKLIGRLGKVALSKYIDCGQTQGFPSADTYEVHLSVLTQVHRQGATEATLATVVEAAARPMSHKGDYSRCSTKGELESRIIAQTKTRLAK